ncbi:chromosome partition protein Smc [Desulfosporosinus acididurans]|uniref:Chromosome partition protein Smc n=1 Tax=Desulfosporosinus acididurans TaxID=476652 RepID=A0A0J1FU06_9FIRM|nr:hypothetical protein [Desulfosporosinus acididurans]KLU66782.1 chromosome partition protein Smc [Desulfosporosinus acididurans]
MSDEAKNKPPLYSVRTNDEVMADVSALVERTGLSQKDLFSAMVTQFKANLLSGSEIEQTEDMQQLRYHLSHAESIFSNMVQKLRDLKNSYTQGLEQEKRVHQSVVDQVENGRLQAEEERDKSRLELAEIQEQMKELAERNNELEAVNKSNRITIDLLTSQNESLEHRIKAVDELEAEVQRLRYLHEESQRQIEKLRSEAIQHHHAIEIKEQSIVSLEKSHANELASVQKMADLQIHAASMEANNRVLEATTKLKDEYTAKLDALQEKNQSLTARVHELELGKTKRN